jgi:hypothetical protein
MPNSSCHPEQARDLQLVLKDGPQIPRTKTRARKTIFEMGRSPARLAAPDLTHFFPKNFPTPTRTCTELIPGFGEERPPFEMCM